MVFLESQKFVPSQERNLLQHAYPSPWARLSLAGSAKVRPHIAMYFHETVNLCFNTALEGMGGRARDLIYACLERKGVARADIATRFDQVVRVLTDSFGGSARIIIYRTLVEVHREYSLRADFTYQDSLRERMMVLQDRVIADHLCPRHLQKGDPYLDFQKPVQLVSPLQVAH